MIDPNVPIPPPTIPPTIPPPPIPPIPPFGRPDSAPGDQPEEREPIAGVLAVAEAMLRQPRRVMYQLQQPGSGRLIAAMLAVAILCLGIYGLIVGSFSGGMQLWAAPAKIVSGLLGAAFICLPSLYIFTCLSGSQARLREVIGYVAGVLLLIGILLVGFAPVAWIFSQSTQSLAWMGFLHLLFWFIASIFGLRFLGGGFAHAKARTNAGLYVWILIFLLTSLQMMTALRPLIGKADTFLPREKMFFVTHWYHNVDAESETKH